MSTLLMEREVKQGEKIHFDLAGHRFIVWQTEADFRIQLDRRLAALSDAQGV